MRKTDDSHDIFHDTTKNATPKNRVSRCGIYHAPEGTRTPHLLIRSQMLYPIELRAQQRNAYCALSYDGRYKTRTCDLHDVNVAL